MGLLFDALVALGESTSEKKKKEEEEKKKKLAQLKREWGLTTSEAELVLKKEYDPWNFSEPGESDELEEDDYYFDDQE